ncbi:MAG: zinc-ribbon domain-containing protein [Archangium sp.]
MKVSCPSCSSILNIDDKKIPAGGARIKCPTCQNIFPVKPPPASSGSGMVPLPGLSAAQPQKQAWEEEATRVGSVPLPGASGIPGATTVAAPPTNVRLPAMRSASSTAVPLPGISAAKPQAQSWEDEATRVGDVPLPGPAGVDLEMGSDAPTGAYEARTASIPLPGAGVHEASTSLAPAYQPPSNSWDDGAVPLPGNEGATSLAPAYEAPHTQPARGAVPLPGGAPRASAGGGIPLPGGAAPRPSGGGIPLPGASSSPSSGGIPLPGGRASSGGGIPLPGASSSPSSGGIPLPGGRASSGGGIPLPGGAPPPLPKSRGSSPGSAVPLPGNNGYGADPAEYDPTAVPLPSSSSSATFESGGTCFRFGLRL